MEAARLARVALVLADTSGTPVLERLMTLAVELLAVSGASISVIDEGQHRGSIAMSSERFGAIDDLQFELGEGPAITADQAARAVLEPDLERAGLWPLFARAVGQRRIAAVFAFPLQLGAVQLGVLSLYRETSGDLDDANVSDAVTLTHVATHLLLEREADTAPGVVPSRLDVVVAHRARVHQATGMVAAQLDVDVGSALIRLRAHAWANDRPLDDVAADVVARHLRFERDR